MSLKSLLSSGKLRHKTSSAEEISELLAVVERDINDASLTGLSPDRRFATAYNAVLQLATTVLRAEGYRTAGMGHHATTFAVLPSIMGQSLRGKADFFDACRSKRNVTDYGRVGAVSESEADELLVVATEFRDEVLAWLGSKD